MGLRLRVEVVAGTPIQEAAFGMVHVANALNMTVESEFSGVAIEAAPYVDPMAVMDTYQSALERKDREASDAV